MKNQKMIVVTGATGFIGSNLLYALESKGYTNIVGIDNFGTGEKWKNVAKRSCVFFVLPDQMKDYLDIHTQDISAIIHLGGISTTTETNVDEIVRTNIQLSTYMSIVRSTIFSSYMLPLQRHMGIVLMIGTALKTIRILIV